MFDPAEFFSAFRQHGLLTCARVVSGEFAGADLDVNFVQPGELVLSDAAQSIEYAIEYETHLAPAMRVGDVLTIEGRDYTVRAPPQPRSDGYFSLAALSRV